MSQSRERRSHSRWSEPCLHKCSSFHSASASEDEGASRAYPSLLTATRSRVSPEESPASVCYVCCICEQCNETKSSKRATAIHQKKLGGEQRLRETLQVYLIKTQVDETMMDDKRTGLMQHLSLISNTFEAVVQHVQSLQVSYLTAKRIFDMNHAFFACHSSAGADCVDNIISHYRQVDVERKKIISSLRELADRCSKNAALPKDVRVLLDDHKDRKTNFFLACANFKSLLENAKLSVPRMEKLQRQYDTILKDFQQSRRLLDAELPKIIHSRLETLQGIFHNVAELYGNVDRYNTYATTLFKLFPLTLRHAAPSDIEKCMSQEEEANKEIR